MIKANPAGCSPDIDPSSHIDETAVIIGSVTIGRNVFVGPGAVIRADETGSKIIINDNCNIQDRVIIHGLEHSVVAVDAHTSLAHGSIIHGPCSIGANCFIGFGSVVFKAEISNGVVIKHNCCIENVPIPPDSLIASGSIITAEEDTANVKKTSAADRTFAQKVVDVNRGLVKGYRGTQSRQE